MAPNQHNTTDAFTEGNLDESEPDIKTDLLKRLSNLQEGEPQPEFGMQTHVCKMIEVNAGELRAAAKANPDHPIAKQWKYHLRNLPDKYRLTVEQCDLEALLKNLEVITDHTHDEAEGMGTIVCTKRVGKKAPEADAPTPTSHSSTADPAAPSTLTKNQVATTAGPVNPQSADVAAGSPGPTTPENFDKEPGQRPEKKTK
jgi:hypothetical protein